MACMPRIILKSATWMKTIDESLGLTLSECSGKGLLLTYHSFTLHKLCMTIVDWQCYIEYLTGNIN